MTNPITTLSRQDLIDSLENGIGLSFAEEREACRALLAVMDANLAPVWGQARFKGGNWTSCSAEHAAMVMANPEEWGDYECRYLYTTPPAPSAPDGWKLVPVEPTEKMVINGFESRPGQEFSEPTVWEKYSQMSGCQQAAYKAQLCWAAMLAAAPAPGGE